MKNIRKILLFCLIAVICISMMACGAKNDSEVGEMAPGGTISGTGSNAIVSDSIDRKIVYTVSMRVTSKDISAFENELSEKSKALGGYVETNNEEYSDGECISIYTVYRIPTEKLDEFVNSIEGKATVEKKSVNTSDITTQYVDAQSEKHALEERKAQLENLLKTVDMSAGEQISIINEISNVNKELQAIELMISEYDSEVEFSSVSISINQPKSFLDVFIPAVIVIVICLIPFFAPAIVLIIIFFTRKRKAQRNKKA